MTTYIPQIEDPRAEAVQPPGIELHSIDWVPKSERHGKVSHLGAIWFVGNINLTAMATGVTTLSIGAVGPMGVHPRLRHVGRDRSRSHRTADLPRP